jgi:hypothetical protein
MNPTQTRTAQGDLDPLVVSLSNHGPATINASLIANPAGAGSPSTGSG